MCTSMTTGLKFVRCVLALVAGLGLMWGSLGAADAVGAKPGETASLQARIDAAAAAGGGVVRISPGDHLVSDLELKSNVTLELPAGARLVASTNYLDYTTFENVSRAMLWATNAVNVTVCGKGEIDGRGWAAVMKSGDARRWKFAVFYRVKGVRMEGITLRDSGSWGCYFKECEDVYAARVKMRSLKNHNNDGFDIDAKNVLIENCDLDTDDDAICLKSDNPDFICENVEVRNCRLASNCNHIKFGTSSFGGFRNVRIHDCELVPCSTNIIPQIKNSKGSANDIPGWDKREIGSRCGLALECVDGGFLENVHIRNIKMNRSCQTPIFVRLGRRHAAPENRVSYLKDVVIENISGESMSYLASSITGVPGLRPAQVTLRNINLTVKGGGPQDEVARPVPEAEKKYPENRMFSRQMLPAYGFYIRHADGIVFERVRVNYTGKDEGRPAVFADDATAVTLKDCHFKKPASHHATVYGVADGAPDVREELRPQSKMESESTQKGRGVGPYGNLWWANRFWSRQHAVEAVKGRKVDLVMIGDSITHFWEWKHPASWASLTNGHTVINCGYGGDCTQHVLWRMGHGELDGYVAKNVAIMIGTNNNKARTTDPEDVAAAIERIVSIVKAKQPRAKILLHAIFPRGASEQSRHAGPRRRNDQTNARLKKLAASDPSLVWIDIGPELVDETGWVPKTVMGDGLHPSDIGYAVWAKALKRALGW